MTAERLGLIGALVLLGAGWGATQPLAKIAVSTGHQPLGLVFWQMAIGAVFLCAITYARGRPLPFQGRHMVVYGVIALIGTILPNSASYAAIAQLPSGIISILLSMVPMMAFPIALLMALERFSWVRLAGLSLGLAGVLLIVGPEASLPEAAMAAFIPLALIAPAFYALEGNVVAKWGTAGLDPIQVLAGASLIGTIISAPLALLSGQWVDPGPPLGAPEVALILGAVIHAITYTGYVWMIGRTGPVFAVQVSYLVTGFGVFWAMLILGEAYSGWVWAAMVLMLGGVFLVQPKSAQALAEPPKAGDTVP
jgi:drug/metabolite transporter (DMT)-like permease